MSQERKIMSITELVDIYQKALTPIFKDELHIIYDGEDFISIILDGDKEDFFFTLYGIDAVRLYWCNECFIFDKARNLLVSSDTHGEIVYEEKIEIATLPQMIIDLVKYLKDVVFISKEEQIIGKTPWGYDNIKTYVIKAKGLKGTIAADYVIGNIRIEIC
ncbi:MAG: hypothetical protein IJZ96_06150 [Lachnospiraceae bacterium]|nr:hypothetical protein [Lachnospiraceae bacterium]